MGYSDSNMVVDVDARKSTRDNAGDVDARKGTRSSC